MDHVAVTIESCETVKIFFDPYLVMPKRAKFEDLALTTQKTANYNEIAREVDTAAKWALRSIWYDCVQKTSESS